jgi:hypothetical protein
MAGTTRRFWTTKRIVMTALVAALVLCAALALSGCHRAGTAGVSTTAEGASPTFSDPGATTEPPLTDEQRKIRDAQYVMRDQVAGIDLFATRPVEDCVTESQLIVHGTVTKVDPARAGTGDVANPYVVFYVEPEEVLKGSPRFGSPIAFALLAPVQVTADSSGQTAAGSPVAEGDEVLLFSYAFEKDLATSSGARGAYFPWNDRYGIYLPEGNKFVDVMRSFDSTTLKAVRALVGPKDTSTTLPPGYLCFNGKTARFEDRLRGKKLAGTLPYEVLPQAEFDWLSDVVAPASMTAAKGYRLANGDLVFLWNTLWLGASWSDAEPTVLKALEAAAMEKYSMSADQVWAFWYGEFGYVVVSKDYVRQLGHLAQMAETGEPLNPNPAPGG